MIQVVQQSNRPSSTLGFCFHCKASSVQPGKLASGGKWWQVVASGGKWWQVVASGGKWWQVSQDSQPLERQPLSEVPALAQRSSFFLQQLHKNLAMLVQIVVNNDSTSRNTENAMCSKTVPLVPLYLRVSKSRPDERGILRTIANSFGWLFRLP